ncbi:MAG TPA: rhamnogalacturonan lyase [Blastocatellia bacterium]|nr:rhamnogalacturonan lyase [Blastocatellia bacterium]
MIMTINLLLLIASILALSLAPTESPAPRQMETLGRGVIAVNQGEGKVFVSWRLLGNDPEATAFNLYRATGGAKPIKLNAKPLTEVTSFVDEKVDLTKAVSYFVRSIINGRERESSKSFTLPANAPVRQYLSIPLQTPQGYAPNDASVGDLDGDGEYEIVLHQAGRGRDNSQAGMTDPPILEAYKLDGALLWRINLGRNIREGAHYTQFMVYDLDGDGKAEVVCKTADGTVDGKGKVIGDANADWRNPEGSFMTTVDRSGAEARRNTTGYVLAGPEYLTIFDGLTGAALATTDYIPPRHPAKLNPTADEMKAIWGDGYGNRVDRFLAAIAYLDGKRPSLVMCRGYYTRSVLVAWNWRDGKLTRVWTFDSADEGNKGYAGQGNHNLSVGDVDGDGRDEIVYGACVIDDNGKGLYTTGLGHGDAMHLSDLDPARPGLEVFDIQERFDDAGAHFRDSKTGEVLWKKPSIRAGADGEGPGRGLALDIDPRHSGFECWVKGAGVTGLFNARGEKISDREPRSCNFGVFWDGDTLSELLDRNMIFKWDWAESKETVMLTAEGCASNNGTKATPALSADILGDWREEVIWRTTDNKELRIYTTTIPTKHRFYTLMHDPQYRLSIAWQNVAYNQPPHTSFFMGEGMAKPPRPVITTSVKRAR